MNPHAFSDFEQLATLSGINSAATGKDHHAAGKAETERQQRVKHRHGQECWQSNQRLRDAGENRPGRARQRRQPPHQCPGRGGILSLDQDDAVPRAMDGQLNRLANGEHRASFLESACLG
jgi:hypothetical protein